MIPFKSTLPMKDFLDTLNKQKANVVFTHETNSTPSQHFVITKDRYDSGNHANYYHIYVNGLLLPVDIVGTEANAFLVMSILYKILSTSNNAKSFISTEDVQLRIEEYLPLLQKWIEDPQSMEVNNINLYPKWY
ncbi:MULTISPECIES: hypothetical protein [Bacillus]|uniref:hypothetical protein n=1 Tax=Bacillus TaxID=1386 RepID=UPI0011EE8F2F|nr:MULTISPECIES: hypothetical protein [Bacillus]KAA0784632.1 hypothetical protein DN393_21575 [Bacillus sp. BPN334]MRS26450.1 hypothetical protein [Bacillus sp. RIT694]